MRLGAQVRLESQRLSALAHTKFLFHQYRLWPSEIAWWLSPSIPGQWCVLENSTSHSLGAAWILVS
jgi:hypothetical protein